MDQSSEFEPLAVANLGVRTRRQLSSYFSFVEQFLGDGGKIAMLVMVLLATLTVTGRSLRAERETRSKALS